MIFLSAQKKLATTIFAAVVILLAAISNFAQAPPPKPALDYFPQNWKEYTYEADNMRVRFPAEPKITTQTEQKPSGTVTTRSYNHRSFIELSLSVHEYPPTVDFEKIMPVKEILETMREAGLAEISKLSPQIIKEADVTVDGYAGKFIHLEANNGEVLRCKFFVAKNRLYFVYASVTKGSKHGSNYENDFEKVAMGFLDSLRLITPKTARNSSAGFPR